MKKDYKLNSTAWIYNGGTPNDLTKGKVVHIFTLDRGVKQTFYVIEIDTHIDPIYEVRTTSEMSPSKNKPIGMWYEIGQMMRDKENK